MAKRLFRPVWSLVSGPTARGGRTAREKWVMERAGGDVAESRRG
jgi:hypothetical protein